MISYCHIAIVISRIASLYYSQKLVAGCGGIFSSSCHCDQDVIGVYVAQLHSYYFAKSVRMNFAQFIGVLHSGRYRDNL